MRSTMKPFSSLKTAGVGGDRRWFRGWRSVAKSGPQSPAPEPFHSPPPPPPTHPLHPLSDVNNQLGGGGGAQDKTDGCHGPCFSVVLDPNTAQHRRGGPLFCGAHLNSPLHLLT